MTAVLAERSVLAGDPAGCVARGPRAAGSAGGIGRGDVRLLVSNGDSDVTHDDVRRSAAALAGRRRAGREHVGDDCRPRSTQPVPTARRCVSTSRPSCRVACGWSSPDSRSTTQPRRSPAISPAPTSRSRAAATCTCSNASAARRRLWIATPHVATTVLDHLAQYGEPIRYRHAPDKWPLAAYQQIFGE